MTAKYKDTLSHFEAMRTKDGISRPAVNYEHQVAIVACGGSELERLTPAQIKFVCEDRIKVLETLGGDHGEELSLFRQRWTEADARSPKNTNPPTTATATDNSQALSESIARENVLRARNSDLEAQISDLQGQVSDGQTEAQALRERVTRLENGAELKATRDEAERCRNAAAISDRNVSLLERYCQVGGMDVAKAVAAVTDKSLQPRGPRGGKAVIRRLIRNGQPVPIDEQLLELQQ